jgi:hypothetical protein
MEHRNAAPNGDGGFAVKRTSVFVAIVLMVGLTVMAQAPREGGWVPLFNGTDLNGWKKNGMRSGSLKKIRFCVKARPTNTAT